MEWQDISTAPKDGTLILVCSKWGTWAARFVERYTSGYKPANPWMVMLLNMEHMGNAKHFAPTHWMPLPSPPKPTHKDKD